MDFTPITTQEDFDKALQEKLTEALQSKEQDYQGRISKLSDKLKASEQAVADLTSQNKSSQAQLTKMRIAGEMGLPLELANRMTGETDEEIQKDAEVLAKYIHKPQATPVYTAEQPPETSEKASLRAILHSLNQN